MLFKSTTLFLVEGAHSTLLGEWEVYVRKLANVSWSSFGCRMRHLGWAGQGGSLGQRSQRTIKALVGQCHPEDDLVGQRHPGV